MHPPFDGPDDAITAICYRCQMRLPLRLTRPVVGPRGGVDEVCAACYPEPGPNGDAKRAEVVAMRRKARPMGVWK